MVTLFRQVRYGSLTEARQDTCELLRWMEIVRLGTPEGGED